MASSFGRAWSIFKLLLPSSRKKYKQRVSENTQLNSDNFPVGAITTTEVCNLSCVMCHFNGPRAEKKQRTLSVQQVENVMKQIPKGRELWLAGTGDFFMDPNALEHVRRARQLGHQPCILTHGQLLTPETIDKLLEYGVRFIRISVDAIDAETYKRIRLGGKFDAVLAACAYLRGKKDRYPDLRVEISNTVLKPDENQIERYCDFWRGKVDGVNFNAMYHDTFHFRNTFQPIPEKRNDCELSVYVLPSGRMAPCCATMVVQHTQDQDWMPHIDQTSPKDAYRLFLEMYKDPNSALRQICQKCGWWIMWAYDEKGQTPYWRSIDLSK